MSAVVLALKALRFFTSKAGLITLAVVFGLAALAYATHRVYKAGEEHVQNVQHKQALESIKRSEDGRRAVDDCYALGGVWRRENGTCVRDVP